MWASAILPVTIGSSRVTSVCGSCEPCSNSTSIPARNCSRSNRLQSTPISSPTRFASSTVVLFAMPQWYDAPQNGYTVSTNTSLFITYLVTATVLMLTPGPDMLFCLASGLRGGARAGFAAAVGAATGEVVHISAAAAGLAALFRAAPLLYDGVRILGACYLVWLGIRALRHRDAGLGGRQASGRNRAFLRGLTTNLLNPKMALFSIAFLPQFVDPGRSVALQFVVLGACFVTLEIVVDGTVGILAGRFRTFFGSRRATRNLNVASGFVFLGLGARVGDRALVELVGLCREHADGFLVGMRDRLQPRAEQRRPDERR